jgi:hypothetical protein
MHQNRAVWRAAGDRGDVIAIALRNTTREFSKITGMPMSADPFYHFVRIELRMTAPDLTRRNGMARRSPPRKVTYFEPVAPRLGRNTIIEPTFEVGRRFRCTMRVDCGQIDPGTVIRPGPGEWRPRMPERLDGEELADWRRAQCGLSARRADDRHSPRGRRCVGRGLGKHRLGKAIAGDLGNPPVTLDERPLPAVGGMPPSEMSDKWG